MSTVFDINFLANNRRIQPDRFNFDIITPYGDYRLQWLLTVQKKLTLDAQRNDSFITISRLSTLMDAEFSLILAQNNSSNTVVKCATFSIERLVIDTNVETQQHACLLSNVVTLDAHVRRSCQAKNVKIGDTLKFPMTIEHGYCVRCTITLEESVDASLPSSPAIAAKLLNDAMAATEHGQFTDVILTTADDRKYYAHSYFLAKQSSVFNAMLKDENFKEGQERQIENPDINSSTMEEILRYIYTESVNADALKVMAPEILYAAEKYHLPDPLKLQCSQAMIDSMSIKNALISLQTADMYSLDKLKRCALKMLVDNLNQVQKQDGWKEFVKNQSDLVCEIFAFAATYLKLN